MSRRLWRFTASLRLVVACAAFSGVLLASGGPALAASPSSGSVTIVAVVAPVRYILVNGNGKITEILSNGQTDVTPIVYKDKFNTVPIAFSPAIRSQYAAILAHIDTRRTGVIYQFKAAPAKKPTDLFARIRLSRY